MSKWIYKGRRQPDSILSISNTIINIIFFSLQHQAQLLSCPLPVRHFLKNSRYHSTYHPNPTHFNFKMRFFTAATFVLAAAAAPVDQSETSASGQIEKRLDPITISIITGVTSAAAGWATTEGLNTLKGLIKDNSSWDKVSTH